MYLTEKRRGNGRYYYLQRSYREEGTNKKRTEHIMYLGAEPVISRRTLTGLAGKYGVPESKLRAIKGLIVLEGPKAKEFSARRASARRKLGEGYDVLGSLVEGCASSADECDHELAQCTLGLVRAVEENDQDRVQDALSAWHGLISTHEVYIEPSFVWDPRRHGTRMLASQGGRTWPGSPAGNFVFGQMLRWLESGCKPEIGICRGRCGRVYLKSSGQRKQRYCSQNCR